MSINDIIGTVSATEPKLPLIKASGYEWVVAANGLFIRAADRRIEALVPVTYHADAALYRNGLHPVKAFAQLLLPRVHREAMAFFHDLAKVALPNEVLIQCHWSMSFCQWFGILPAQTGSPGSIEYCDESHAVIDLHSHGTLPAFFSQTDDADEQGFRFYVVIGKIGTPEPEIACRVGIYGHHMRVPASTLFDDIAPFRDVYEGARDDAAV